MSKKLLLFFTLLFQAAFLFAQVPPACEPPGETQPAENCQSACINCNFNGYMGNSGGFGADPAPLGWCSNIQNDQWLGFIAGSTGATFTITPSNCTQGQGLQAAVYPAGCNDEPLACNPGCATCGSTPTSFTVTNMIPGSNYYLIIDGYSQDDCDFTITVAPPSAVQAPNVGLVSQISGPNTICSGGSSNYGVNVVSGAGFYTWTTNTPGVLFNGNEAPVDLEAPSGNNVMVTFPTGLANGTQIQICLTPVNSCSEGTQRCKTITIQNIATTNIPKAVVCNEDQPYMLPWGDEVSGPPGTTNHEFTFTTPQGCDSLVRTQVQILPVKSINQTRYICTGNCVTICNVQYCDQGLHVETCDSYQGCDSTINLTLNVLNPIANITGPTVIPCSSNCITLSSTASPNFPGVSIKVWKNLATGATQGGETYQVCAPGMYELTTTMSAGGIQCTKKDTVTVTAMIPPTASGVNGVLGCQGGNATISVTTTAINPTFSWVGPGAFLSGVQTPNITQPGTYTVTVTSAPPAGNGCTVVATAVVTGNTTPPTANAVGAEISCTNTTVTITASSSTPSNYVWSNAANTASTTVTAGGTYTVTVTDQANGCTSTATTTVTTNTAPPGGSASVSSAISCPSPIATITATSAASNPTYTWPASVTPSGATATATIAGTYIVTITGSNGCTSTASATVTGNTNLPDATALGVALDCNTQSDTIFGGSTTAGVTYSWIVGGSTVNTRNIIVNTPGTYTVTVTAANGCTQTASATANGNFTAPNASATGGIITCGVNTIQISGNSTTPGVTYNWVGPGGTPFPGQNINVSAPGTYTLTVRGTNGCTTTATAQVTPDANIPQIDVQGDTISCTNPAATIIGSSTTSGVTYTWSGPPGGITPGNETNPTQNVTVNGTYTLVVNNPANGCSAQSTAFVLLDTNTPNIVANDDTLTCAQPNLQLFSNSTTPGVTYEWTGPSGENYTGATPVVTAAGIYTVVVTAGNGCTNSTTADVSADQGIPVLSTAANTLTCTTQSVMINTTSSLPVGFDWDGPNNFDSQDQNPMVTEPGDYTVVATASNGCTSSAVITVNQNIAAPNSAAAGGQLTCLLPMLNLQGSSSTPGAIFFWPALNTSLQNPQVSASGTYTLQVTGTNGCTSTAQATVTQNIETAAIQIGTPTTLDCNVLNTTLPTDITSTTAIQTISWSNGAAVEDPSVMAPGTYTVTVTLANGCTSTGSVVATQDISAPDAAATGGTLTCSVPSFNLVGTSSTPGANFDWSGGLPSVPDPSVTQDGAYTLTVTGPNGCTETAVATVLIDTIAPGAQVASSNVLDCDDLSATLSATTNSGTTYAWMGPGLSNPTTPTVTVSAAGDYTVEVTAANGCTSMAVFTQLEDVTPPDASATGGTTDCLSGAVTISGNSTTTGVNYVWTGPAGGTFPTQNPSVSTPGTYTLKVTAPNGCTTTATAVVIENTDTPTATIQGSGILTCAVTSIDLTGITTTPNTTIEWTLPDNSSTSTGTVSATEPGVYTFTVTSTVNGCVNTETIDMGQNITPPAGLVANGGTIDCGDPTVTLTGGSGVANASYEWTGPGGEMYPTQNPVVDAAGIYTLVVTNPINGCTSTDQAEVLASLDLPEISAASEIITCLLPVITLDATSNVANGTYVWTGPAPFNSSTLEDPTTSTSGTYTVVVTNPVNNCTASFSIEVNEDTATPQVSTADGQITCQMPSTALDGSSTTAGVTYVWTSPGGQVFNTQNPTVSEPGNYTLVVTAQNGCTSTAIANIAPDQNIPVVSVTGGLITCANPTVGLTGAANKPNVVYAWNGPGFTSTDQNPTISAPGTYTLVVTTPVNGCTGQASIVVNDDVVAPAVSVETPDQLDCSTTQVGLVATVAVPGTYTYSWTTIDGNILSGAGTNTPTVSQAALYTVLVTNTVNGCTSTRNVPVTVDPAIPAAINADIRDVSCYGYTNGAVTVAGVEGGTSPFLFSIDNQPFIAATAFNSLPPGTHTLRVQDANGCELETSFVVSEPAELLVELGPDTTIFLGDQITISLNNTVNYPGRVETSLLQPTYLDTLLGQPFLPKYSLQYQLTVVDSNGCRDSDTRTIIVDRTRHIFVPNVFDPNGSGVENSILTVYGGNDVELIKSFNIYDRWGELVHSATDFPPGDQNAAWLGKIRGKVADPAVFVYAVEVLFKDGEIELFSGDITVAGRSK